MYVLLTKEETYFVEYLIGSLILSNSISEAMVFDNKDIALKFQKRLFNQCQLETSVNTFLS